MKRGAIVVVAARGAYTGKPRPAVVVQSDLFNPTHASVTLCPITSDCVDAPLFRLNLSPGERTGLKKVSQVMIDKIVERSPQRREGRNRPVRRPGTRGHGRLSQALARAELSLEGHPLTVKYEILERQ